VYTYVLHWVKTVTEQEAVMSEMGQLMDSVSAPILAIDASFCILHWNQTLAQLTGIHKEDVVGK
jgi:PAS domain S-box-containing protein